MMQGVVDDVVWQGLLYDPLHVMSLLVRSTILLLNTTSSLTKMYLVFMNLLMVCGGHANKCRAPASLCL